LGWSPKHTYTRRGDGELADAAYIYTLMTEMYELYGFITNIELFAAYFIVVVAGCSHEVQQWRMYSRLDGVFDPDARRDLCLAQRNIDMASSLTACKLQITVPRGFCKPHSILIAAMRSNKILSRTSDRALESVDTVKCTVSLWSMVVSVALVCRVELCAK
jgi:hypothetical protein